METNSISRRYETRRSTRAKELAKSRVDWNRTKRSRLLDSEEEEDETTSASEKEIQTSSDDEGEEKDESAANGSKEETTVNGSSLPGVEAGCDGSAAEDREEESIIPGKHKRSRSSVMYDSDTSDESGIVRKVFAKRSCIIDEDLSTDEEQQTSPVEEATKRKQKRLMKLQELSQRRSTRAWSDRNHHEDSEDDAVILEDTYQPSLSPTEISDSADDGSMKDFIVEEEDEEDNELEQEKSENGESQPQKEKHAVSSKTLLEHYVPSLHHVDPCTHLQRIVRAFLINAADDTFLISLYAGERHKKYAQEMLSSLHYLDDRFIRPRLENLLSRSRWKERYKERVDNYPNVCIVFGSAERRFCQACELQRYCKLTVILSGQQYNSDTMEIDDFMSHDKQRLKVGSVCGGRTQVYHNLKHFKYKLYQDCCSVMKKDGYQDEPLKDTVDRVFSQLYEDGWIHKHYTDLEDYMNDADFFQEEKMD
ncbi:coiled-coil domain-containing protein 82 [Eublepharis macularius]|uniref:Coiled-coil domain-containing protein 82 n=1 Tax=Eublepharis macularius TaxID=481883 RepID=A0AA97J405_EUBMA|nr:coiled-coil domain-containing protein 82 [Eublepharis macularius]